MRRTGQTFRTVLGALKLASEGNHIIYACPTHNMARWTFDKAARITADFMEPEIPEKLVLKIGNGTVKFVARLNDKELREIESSEKYKLVTDR